MTPIEFFETVTLVNVREFHARTGDYRLATNAFLSFDAFLGILHLHLREAKHPYVANRAKDSQFKAALADRYLSLKLIRDTAYSLKHGQLETRPRLVFDARQMVS